MHIVRPRAYSHPVLPDARVTILGAGKVTTSVLLSASLLRPTIPFRVIARSSRSAELVRQFLNDLPRLNVELLSSPVVPDLCNELVVLALGEQTARFSKRSKKQSLYAKNEQLIADLLPQLGSSVVIVVTNPSTAITAYLVEQGVEAYGVGVANDQLRFNNQAGDVLADHYFVGAHNFHELILGSRHSTKRTNLLFSHDDYRNILAKQDRKVLSRNNLPHSFLDFDWTSLEKVNASFPPEYRWYARQRIHSKFHSTAISCSLAILNTICFFTKRQPLYNNFSLEMPLYLPGADRDVVLGWPIDGASMQPLELAFDDPGGRKLTEVSQKYTVKQRTDTNPTFYFSSPFGDRISINAHPSLVHDFFQFRLAHLFALSSIARQDAKILAEVEVVATRKLIDDASAGYSDSQWAVVPQHRGKNPQEHTDLRVLEISGGRVVRFPGEDAIALLQDSKRKATIYCADRDTLFHELRRLVRDEIGIPSLVSAALASCTPGC